MIEKIPLWINLKCVKNVWSFPGVQNKGHPATFPRELPERCIKQFSYDKDTIFDPFAGTGTTLLACLSESSQRKAIGVEIDPQYCDLAAERIKAELERIKAEIEQTRVTDFMEGELA